MRYYQDGDRIFVFGFSRGAYTARVLAGMLHKVGLLTSGNEELISFAWDLFVKERSFEVARGFRHTFARKVQLHFLGLWDTVSSVGWALNPHHYQFTANNPSVRRIRHAVSLDERRTYFVQNLWGTDPMKDQDRLEVWFPGVHCDVGGGYPGSCNLSQIALAWMVREAECAGVRFHPKAKAERLANVTDCLAAAAHESLHGWWWIPEWLPKRVKDPLRGFQGGWILPRGRRRTVESGAHIHTSVLARAQEGVKRPPNLPAEWTEVK